MLRHLSKAIFVFGIIFLLIVALISTNVKTRLLEHKIPSEKSVVDSIKVHFIHGGVTNDRCSYQYERLGGYLGGHVEVEYKNSVFGFLADSLPINYIPRKSKNSKFEKTSYSKWIKQTKYDRVTSVVIPITKEQSISLNRILFKYNETAPCDYAFFGQRCASLTAEILSRSEIINDFSSFESVVSFFYPRALRFSLLDFAEKNELTIEHRGGIDCVNWE